MKHLGLPAAKTVPSNYWRLFNGRGDADDIAQVVFWSHIVWYKYPGSIHKEKVALQGANIGNCSFIASISGAAHLLSNQEGKNRLRAFDTGVEYREGDYSCWQD
jgi:hypothetical protein